MDLSEICELFECLLCFEQLGDRSKVLPCQHTFCRECLDNWYAKKGYLQCPECRVDYQGTTVDSLSPNVFLERIINEFSKKDESNSKNGEKDFKKEQSKRPKRTLWKWEGVGNNQKHPCAKALYSFQGIEDGDLSFSKGDIIMLSDILDENWYKGVLNGKTGVFPVNFVKVMTPFPSLDAVSKQEPLARALYNFDHGTEDHLIVFSKGDIISVVKKIDENWCEGLLGDQHGIFPVNHVELNAAAEVLFASTESSDEEEECTENSQQKATSSNRVSKAETPKRHTIHIDNPDEQRIVQSQQILEYSNSNAHNRGRRASETSLQDSVQQFPAVRTSTSSNGIQDRQNRGSTSNERFSRSTSNPGATARENRSESTPPSRMVPFDPSPALFMCIYSYNGQKADELPLIRGEIYCVIERYRDGWCKGYRARSKSKRTGMFPGNYLKPASHHDQQLMRSRNQSNPSLSLYMQQQQQQQQQRRLAVPSPQHCHSSSAPVAMRHHVCRHFQPLPNGTATQHPSNGRVRSGSEPIDPSTVARDKSRSGLGSFIRKLKKKKAIPAPVPPPYSSVPSASHRFERPVPFLPSGPPPPYSPPSRRRAQPPKSPTADVPQSFLYNYDRYRAVVEFPPQSELELELKPGDVIYVLKRREDGWYHGKSQRTGKVGLFPASFVSRY